MVYKWPNGSWERIPPPGKLYSRQYIHKYRANSFVITECSNSTWKVDRWHIYRHPDTGVILAQMSLVPHIKLWCESRFLDFGYTYGVLVVYPASQHEGKTKHFIKGMHITEALEIYFGIKQNKH